MGENNEKRNEFMTVRDAASKWNVSVRQVQMYCKRGVLKGAFKLGNSWVIPSGCRKPVYRFVSGTEKD
ncbi:MAG: helix-turn-helix domain-containing protein [Clostridiales bacterium]|nr:helix-turn-helix domain-containing protein [Clostridiales bacterium]